MVPVFCHGQVPATVGSVIRALCVGSISSSAVIPLLLEASTGFVVLLPAHMGLCPLLWAGLVLSNMFLMWVCPA